MLKTNIELWCSCWCQVAKSLMLKMKIIKSNQVRSKFNRKANNILMWGLRKINYYLLG